MREPERRPLADVKHQIGALAAELRQMLSLRWELASLEVRESVRPAKRLVICLAAAGVAAIGALPVLVIALAQALDGKLGLSGTQWSLLFGIALLAGGIVGAYLAWKRFRRRFTAMEQTLGEFREDLVWFKEWAGRADGEPSEGEAGTD